MRERFHFFHPAAFFGSRPACGVASTRSWRCGSHRVEQWKTLRDPVDPVDAAGGEFLWDDEH